MYLQSELPGMDQIHDQQWAMMMNMLQEWEKLTIQHQKYQGNDAQIATILEQFDTNHDGFLEPVTK